MEDPAPELLQRISDRDQDALATFLEQEKSRILGFLRTITGDRLLSVVELDDLFQEVSTAALAGLATAPLDKYEPFAWIQEVARRRVVDAHRFHFEAKRRDAGRQQSLHGSGGDDDGGGFEAFLAASMTSASAAFSRDVRVDRMNQALTELTDEQQQAIQLRYAEGLPTKEIAQRLGKTDVAVRVLLSRSVRELEKRLEDVRPSR